MDGRNWNCWHNVDVSPFFLYESIGDSEASCDVNMASLSTYDNLEVTKTYGQVDDALSCCSDSFESSKDCNDHDIERVQCSKKKGKKKEKDCAKFFRKKSKKKDQESARFDGCNPNYRYSNEDEDDDDNDGVIDQVWSYGKMGYVCSRQQKNKSKVEPVKEDGNDKLFWETCLGS